MCVFIVVNTKHRTNIPYSASPVKLTIDGLSAQFQDISIQKFNISQIMLQTVV